MHNPINTPLAVIAVELGTDVDRLADRFGDAAEIDDLTGLRSIPVAAARQFLTDRRAAVEAARAADRAKREAARRRPNPIRERVRAIGRQQEQFAGADVPALGVLLASDIEDRLQASSARLDEWMDGGAVYHPISTEEAK